MAYISVNNNIISLQENDNTKLNIRILYNGEEILYNNTTVEWVSETDDGGNIEITSDSDNIYYI